MLGEFGVATASDLHLHRALLHELFSPISFDFFMHVCLGLHASTPTDSEARRKGISCERTFAAISDCIQIRAKATEIAASLALDMAREGLAGKCITLKLKQANFEVGTVQLIFVVVR